MPSLRKSLLKGLVKSLTRAMTKIEKEKGAVDKSIEERERTLRESSEAQRLVYSWIAQKKGVPSEAIGILEGKLSERMEPLVDLWIRYHLGKLQYNASQFDECIKTYQALLELHKNKLPLVASITVSKHTQSLSPFKDLEISVGGSIIVSEPLLKDDIAMCFRILGETSRKKKDWESAKEYYNNAIDYSRWVRVTDLKWLGDCHFHMGHFEEALEYFQEARRKSPKLAGICKRIEEARNRLTTE